jgi:hypothetical protein
MRRYMVRNASNKTSAPLRAVEAAKRTDRLNRFILSVLVRNLHIAGKGRESTVEEAQSNPLWPRGFIHPPGVPRKCNDEYAA